MKISPINSTTFTGREIYYLSTNGEEGLKKVKGYYQNSSVEKTLGKDHSYPKNKAYFADPMEFVRQDIKDRVDFVVYDNEPSYPKIEDVKKNYLENNRTDYRKQFEDIREYYYRREMGGFDDINKAKYQQWQAAECTGIYDKAGDLRYKKEITEDEVKALKAERTELQTGIESTQKELKSQKLLNNTLESHIKNLKAMSKPYEALNDISGKGADVENILYTTANTRVNYAKAQEEYIKQLENSDYYNNGKEAYPQDAPKYAKYENTTKTYEAVQKNMEKAFNIGKTKNGLKKQANLLQKTISEFETILNENVKTISDMQEYIKELTTKAVATDSKIKERTAFIDTCKEKLKPLFEELANFYKKQGIKVIKK